jgi:predicted Zn-dependent peptidase
VSGFEVVQSRLANGCTLLVAPMPQMESACVGFWSLAGSRHERARENGLAHFTEHMLFKGTRSRDAAQLMREIEGAGGTIDAFTELDHTCYYAKAEAAKLPGIATVAADLYSRPSFPAAEVAREREVIGEEITMYHDNPGQHIDDLLAAALWPGHPLGRPVTGTKASLHGLGRADLARWVAARHVGRNTLVAVAGPVEPAEVARQAARWTGHLAPGRRSRQRRFVAPRRRTTPAVAADLRPVEQAHFALGFRCPGVGWGGRFALRLLNVLLGENMSSRLFQCLREEHALCYSVSTEAGASGDDGHFAVHAAVDPENLEQALTLTLNQLARIARRPPGKRELAAAADYATAMLRLSLEGTAERMLWAGESFLAHGRVAAPGTVCDRLAAVRPAEVSAAAAAVFQRRSAALAVVGPAADQGGLARRLAGAL